jgi:hypothetical protein
MGIAMPRRTTIIFQIVKKAKKIHSMVWLDIFLSHVDILERFILEGQDIVGIFMFRKKEPRYKDKLIR